VLFSFSLAFTAFDVFFNTLIDQNLSELVLGGFDIELSCGLEGIFQSFIIIIEIEVELGE